MCALSAAVVIAQPFALRRWSPSFAAVKDSLQTGHVQGASRRGTARTGSGPERWRAGTAGRRRGRPSIPRCHGPCSGPARSSLRVVCCGPSDGPAVVLLRSGAGGNQLRAPSRLLAPVGSLPRLHGLTHTPFPPEALTLSLPHRRRRCGRRGIAGPHDGVLFAGAGVVFVCGASGRRKSSHRTVGDVHQFIPHEFLPYSCKAAAYERPRQSGKIHVV